MAKKRKEPHQLDLPFDSEDEPVKSSKPYKAVLAYMLDRDEINGLIAASTAPYVDLPVPEVTADYATYTPEESTALVIGKFRPRKLKKKSTQSPTQ